MMDTNSTESKMQTQSDTIREIQLRADRIESMQKELSKQCNKDKGSSMFNQEDENTERGNWSGKFDFFLSCLGYAVGLGNLWRFPFLAYKHGGGAFLIPYFIFLVLVGLPIFMLELSLGQFTSAGPLTCWNYAPLFKGLGVGSLMVAFYYSIYYNVIIAWSLWYLFASFQSPLPWDKCGSWSTHLCADNVRPCNASDPTEVRFSSNGTCYTNSSSNSSSSTPAAAAAGSLQFVGIFNSTAADAVGVSVKSAAQEFLEYVSLRDKLANFENLGSLRADMSLCLLLAWFIVFLCLIKGIKSSGKVVYFTALFPYVILVILFIRMLSLNGSSVGISYFITPDLSKLRTASPWMDAGVQIFFTLSASEGGLITLASYNRFHNNVVRDSLLIPFCNCLTSLFAGFTVFGYLGYLSLALGSPIESLAQSGSALAFIVYPQAITSLPLPTLWSILFFLMMLTLGLDSQFAVVEAVVTSISDQWRLHKYKTLVILIYCCITFLLGLTMTTDGGSYMLNLLDTFAGGFNVMIIAILECVSIAYVYGARRFAMDIQAMAGNVQFDCIAWSVFKWWWIVCWILITPVFVFVIVIFTFIDYPTLSHAGYNYPKWAEALGWLMTSSVVLAIVLVGLGMWVRQMLMERQSPLVAFHALCQPSADWGPALMANRRKLGYGDGAGDADDGGQVSHAGGGSSGAVVGKWQPQMHADSAKDAIFVSSKNFNSNDDVVGVKIVKHPVD